MKKELTVRYTTLCVGLYVMSLGIALSVRANLGITPISCPPYVLSLGFSPTIGEFTIAMHLLFIIGQMILLGHEFQKRQFLQVLVAFVFGFFIDINDWLLRWAVTDNMILRLAMLVMSCAILGVGIILEVKAQAIYLAGEGIMLAIAKRASAPFPKVKMTFDVCLMLSGVIFSLLMFGTFRGVGVGTVISAFLVGIMVKLITPYMQWVDHLIPGNTVTA